MGGLLAGLTGGVGLCCEGMEEVVHPFFYYAITGSKLL